MKITKRQLRRMIKEEKLKLISEQGHQMYVEDGDLQELGDLIGDLLHYSMEVDFQMKEMGMRYGHLAALGSNARMINKSVREMADRFDSALDDILKFGISESTAGPPISGEQAISLGGSYDDRLRRGKLDTHNMSSNEAAELMAVLQEFGYSLFVGPSVDSNARAIRDALESYPGEFTRDDLLTAIRVTAGRGA